MLPANPLLNATAPAGPHLPVALLRQYAAGALAPAAQHRVEAHTLACTRCADILDGLLQTPAVTTDQALAQLQQRLRRRTQGPAVTRPGLAQRPHRWLAPQLAAAAALLLGLVAGGWWAWQQRHPASRPVLTPVAVQIAPSQSVPAVAPVPPVVAAPTLPYTATPAAKPRQPESYVAARPLKATRATAVASSRARADTQLVAAVSRPAAAVATSPPAAAPVASVSPTGAVAAEVAADSGRLPGSATGLARKAKMMATETAAQVRDKPLAAGVAPIAPRPVGGLVALRDKLRHGGTEFELEAEKPIEGSVYLRLTIGADGKIEKVKVLRSMRDDYDEEAERLVRELSTWTPGLKGGKRAPLEVDVSVPFLKLSSHLPQSD